jgi:hypothetical protein
MTAVKRFIDQAAGGSGGIGTLNLRIVMAMFNLCTTRHIQNIRDRIHNTLISS